MPFLALALKKNIFFDVDVVVKNKSKCGLSLSVLLPTMSMCHYSFPKHFHRIVSAYQASLQKFLKGKSDTYKQLICIMQRVHCQVRVGVFSCQDKYLFRYLWYCGKKTNRMWLRVVCILVDNDTCYYSGQNVVQQIELHFKARTLL